MSVVTVEEHGPVSVIAINRPEKMNAINKAVALELQQAFAAFDASAQRITILTGKGGRAFSAGADVCGYFGPVSTVFGVKFTLDLQFPGDCHVVQAVWLIQR